MVVSYTVRARISLTPTQVDKANEMFDADDYTWANWKADLIDKGLSVHNLNLCVDVIEGDIDLSRGSTMNDLTNAQDFGNNIQNFIISKLGY